MTFKVGPKAQGRTINLGNFANTGMNVSVRFEPGVGMVVIKTIPEKVMQAVRDQNRDQRDIFKKGKLIGNTQRHMLPVASLPIAIYNEWKMEFGDPKRDPDAKRKFRQRLNSSDYRDFRTSEYYI